MATFFVNEGESIQAAINAASAGDTIIVGAGTYNQDININKDVTVISFDGAADTIINGVGSGQFSFPVQINAAGATFGDSNHGFTVNAGTQGAAVYAGASNVHVEGNVINGSSAAAFLQHALLTPGGISNVVIENNTFGGSADQLVYVNGTPSVGVASTNVDFFNNNFSGAAATGLVLEATGSEVSDNTFGSAITGTALSLPLAGNTVEDNDFSAVGSAFDIVTADTVFDMTTNPTAEKLSVVNALAGATITGNDLGNTIRGSNTFGDNLSGGDGNDTLEGRAGDDTLKGGEGDDFLYGNSTATPLGVGVDKATYDQAIDSSHVATNGAGGWTVTTGGAEGTDTLVDVEQVDGAGAGKILLVGNGGYDTIAAAIDAASDGDTIMVSAGAWTLPGGDSGKSLTFLGANAGVSANDMDGDLNTARGPETIIDGSGVDNFRFSSTGLVTFDGFTFTGQHFDSYTTGNDIAFRNNVITDPGAGQVLFAANSDMVTYSDNRITDVTYAGFDVMQLAGNWNGTIGTTVNLTGNVLTDAAGASGFNLSNVTGTIADNIIDGNSYYGFLLANDTDVDVTGNTFQNIINPDPVNVPSWGAGIRTYTPGPGFGLKLDGNTFIDNAVGLGIRVGSDIDPSAVTITNNVFTGNTNHVVNQGITTTDVLLEGTNTVDGVQLSTATDAQLFAIADNVIDGVDVGTYGSVFLKDGHVYLTEDSFFAPTTTTPSLQRAVDAANAGDTIHVDAGTYSGTATTAVDDLTVTAPAGATGLALVLGTGVLNITLAGDSNINVTGNELANIIIGNSGANTLTGLGDNDTLTGGDGDDTFVATAGDTINEAFDGGTDQVFSAEEHTLAPNVENLTLTGNDDVDGTGNELDNVINGNSGENWLKGLGGEDQLNGNAGADLLEGGEDDDTLSGGDGDDEAQYAVGDGQDTFDGGADTDSQFVTGTAAAEVFNINAVSGTQLGINITAAAQAATLANSEIVTQNVEDIFISTGDGGDTVLISGSLAGTGVSTSTIHVLGGVDNDVVDASALTSAHGIEFDGEEGDDTFKSSNAGGDDTFDGCDNGPNGDTVDYSAVTGNGVNVDLANEVATGAGSDTLIDVENVIGTAQIDTIEGDDDDNKVTGNGGNDDITGGDGDDTAVFSGNRANYRVDLLGGGDIVVIDQRGGAPDGTDTVRTVENFQFADGTFTAASVLNDPPELANQIQDQTRNMNAFLQFQFAANTFIDDDGDTLTYTATLANNNPLPAWLTFNAATRTFSGTPPLDFTGQVELKVTASDGGVVTASDTFNLTIITGSPVVVNLTGGNDTYTASDNGETINALAGNDNVTGGLGNDTMNGGTGNDYLTDTGNSMNVANGDDGNDQLYFNGDQNQLFGGTGNDWLGVNGTNNALVGGDGDDSFIGASGSSNTLAGQDGNDLLFANGTGNFLYGQLGNDWIGVSGNSNFLNGAQGNDYLAATGNNNTLDGGAGNDTLQAGTHTGDRFVFHAGYGKDTIINFTPGAGGTDVIDLNGFGIANFAALQPFISDVGGNAVITLNGADILTVNGVTKAQFADGDFLF